VNPAVKGLSRIFSNLSQLPKNHLEPESTFTNKNKFDSVNLSNKIKTKRGRIEPQAETGEKTLPKKIARNFKRGPKFFGGPVV
jgi:hypothetical protein